MNFVLLEFYENPHPTIHIRMVPLVFSLQNLWYKCVFRVDQGTDSNIGHFYLCLWIVDCKSASASPFEPLVHALIVVVHIRYFLLIIVIYSVLEIYVTVSSQSQVLCPVVLKREQRTNQIHSTLFLLMKPLCATIHLPPLHNVSIWLL